MRRSGRGALKLKETGARIPQNMADKQVIFSFIFALPYLTKSKKLVVAINEGKQCNGIPENFTAF